MSNKKEKILREKSLKIKKYKKEKRILFKDQKAKLLIVHKKSLERGQDIDEQFIYRFLNDNTFELLPRIASELYSLRNIVFGQKKTSQQLVRFKILLKLILKIQPRLLDVRYWNALWLLSYVNWEKNPQEWKPSGRSTYSIFRSLVNHLMVKYPIPQFLYSVFFLPIQEQSYELVYIFSFIASGSSVYKVITYQKKAPDLSRRMCHIFINSPLKYNFIEAVRYAQVKALGGTDSLAHKLARGFLGKDFKDDEKFWLIVMQWLCNNPDFKSDKIDSLINFLYYQNRYEENYSLKGRTTSSLLRELKVWENYFEKFDIFNYLDYKSSGINDGYWEIKQRNEDILSIRIWTISEILNSHQLFLEGRYMGHCVYSYSKKIIDEELSIWSLRDCDKRVLTIKVCAKCKAIEQAKGKFNREPNKDEKAILKLWSKENNLGFKI